ncbi:hypothetical protein BSL82_09990 [Tardibacter chloracetimidivorans]|uniref:Nucleoside 2-deoxyribosyltransferase n=1 Tax=Tardibacter chloracetimidivorans TaxID=1921510 RepID=A0A1L3ZVE9_9SPHN|nr:nucleoside 2-deoxyribosyltransferase [Tardibacter chloracetimidivorans]API59603.1 hypothetical protein BSL82_09990 [Tardibacter chloracetimidivorans]
MNTVYLAGPISGLNYQGATDWRDYAREVLAANGIKGLSPMRGKSALAGLDKLGHKPEDCGHLAHLTPLATQRGVMTRDRFDATRCDVLLVNFLGATAVSMGTVMEIAWADNCRIPIVCAMELGNVHEHIMLCEAIGYRVDTLESALDIVVSILG